MSKKKSGASQPPQPPEVARKLQFHLIQLIGLPVIMLIPILALLGAFGETVGSASASNAQLELRVEHPTRFRYKMIDEVTVSLTNSSSQAFPTLQVAFDRQYIEGFSTVTFTPAVSHITDEAYVVELTDLQPGETRMVAASIQAETYGNHSGVITVTPENGEALQVTVGTFTFP